MSVRAGKILQYSRLDWHCFPSLGWIIESRLCIIHLKCSICLVWLSAGFKPDEHHNLRWGNRSTQTPRVGVLYLSNEFMHEITKHGHISDQVWPQRWHRHKLSQFNTRGLLEVYIFYWSAHYVEWWLGWRFNQVLFNLSFVSQWPISHLTLSQRWMSYFIYQQESFL